MSGLDLGGRASRTKQKRRKEMLHNVSTEILYPNREPRTKSEGMLFSKGRAARSKIIAFEVLCKLESVQFRHGRLLNELIQSPKYLFCFFVMEESQSPGFVKKNLH
jgi:hypothetical protein